MQNQRAYYPYMALMSLWMKLVDVDYFEAQRVYKLASKMRDEL